LRVRQADIARRVGLDVSSVNKILNRHPGSVFTEKKIREVLRVARELGYDLSRLKHTHHRRHVRKSAMIAVELSVYRADGGLFDRGTAVVSNISVSGAFLIALVLSRQSIPLGPHMIGLRPLGGVMPLPEILGRAVRFEHAGASVGMAVEFLADQRDNASALYKNVRPERRRNPGSKLG
jgi:hypothetical protein